MSELRSQFAIRGGVVHWRHHAMPTADAATFVMLGGEWARDANAVYMQFSRKKIDLATFVYLNPVYVKDAKAAYDWQGPIKGADPTSFEALDAGTSGRENLTTEVVLQGYARDAKSVFFHYQNEGRATVVRGADPASFVSLRNGFGVDAKGVWFEKTRIAKADPKSWTYFGRGYSADSQRIFYGPTELDGVDRRHFTVVGNPTDGNYATDGTRFFMCATPIPEAQFWSDVNQSFGSAERFFHIAYHGIRETCKQCNGSGDCYCRRNGMPEGECQRCGGNGRCHICGGAGRKV